MFSLGDLVIEDDIDIDNGLSSSPADRFLFERAKVASIL